MALNTAANRRSAAGLPFLPLGPGVTPDVGKDKFWRQSAGWGYGGIAAAAPGVGGVAFMLDDTVLHGGAWWFMFGREVVV